MMFYQVVGAYPKDGFGSRDEAQAYIDGLTEEGQRSQRQTRRRKRSGGGFALAQFERDPFQYSRVRIQGIRAKKLPLQPLGPAQHPSPTSASTTAPMLTASVLFVKSSVGVEEKNGFARAAKVPGAFGYADIIIAE